jgi:hypothetical protein
MSARVINQARYDAVAALVMENFDRIEGARTQASKSLSLTPAAISHVLHGKTKSWNSLKSLVRWFRRQYPGVGDWHSAAVALAREFPAETDWSQMIDPERQQREQLEALAQFQEHLRHA